VEVRYEDWKSPGNNEDTVTIVRFDLRRITLSVAYQPTKPLSMSEWMQKEHATAIINGGYFDNQNNATALVVSNGQSFGSSYNGFGGMLSVDSQGHIALRSLRQHPYDPNNDQLRQATQSSPMLVLNGKATQFNANAASSRRSVIAIDKQGRLLLIVSPSQAFSLGELEDLLVNSDLSINTALNLDGGASTGLYVNTRSQQVAIDAFSNLPIAVIVKAK
jgi:exopolysaccharide biosynthesis protein